MRSPAIKRLLPSAYQDVAFEGTVLADLLDAMEALQAPDEALIGDFGAQFAPYTAREDFLAFLARWVTLDYLVDDSPELSPTDHLVMVSEDELTILKIVRRLGPDVAIDRLNVDRYIPADGGGAKGGDAPIDLSPLKGKTVTGFTSNGTRKLSTANFIGLPSDTTDRMHSGAAWAA